MARAQQRGISALAVWMIVFVGLWLTSTVMLVILYTGQEDLVNENNSLRAAKDRAISTSEERNLELVKEADGRSITIVGLFNQQRERIAEIATGDPEDDAAAVDAKRNEMMDTIAQDNFVPNARRFGNQSMLLALRNLYSEYKGLKARWEEDRDRARQLDQQVAQMTKLLEEQKTEFETRVAGFTTQLADIEADRTRYREERDQAVATLEQEYEQRRGQFEDELREAQADREDSQEKLAQLRERFDAQQKKFGRLIMKPTGLPTAREPDGKILMAVPGDEVVYINLGSQDRITLGMQFTVYSRDTGIPADGRGKARIEVVSMSEDSAECKPVSLAINEIILENDLIANPVYDAKRPLMFVVVGQFDLNYDGRPDDDGAQTIEALIESWGGQIATNLTAMTDFVVAGSQPPRPKAIGGASSDEVRRIEAARRAYELYDDTLDTAQSLSIPVLNQSIFMNFLGYTPGI